MNTEKVAEAAEAKILEYIEKDRYSPEELGRMYCELSYRHAVPQPTPQTDVAVTKAPETTQDEPEPDVEKPAKKKVARKRTTTNKTAPKKEEEEKYKPEDDKEEAADTGDKPTLDEAYEMVREEFDRSTQDRDAEVGDFIALVEKAGFESVDDIKDVNVMLQLLEDTKKLGE